MKKRALRLSLMAATVLILPGVSPVAGQSEAPLDPMAPSHWTATYTSTESDEMVWSPADGYEEAAGVKDLATVEASDPRISGSWAQVRNLRTYPAVEVGDPEVLVTSGSVRLENDGGAWAGTFSGAFDLLGSGFGEEWNVLKGEGGYEGLTAIFERSADGKSFDGVIMSEPPTQPDPISASTE